MRKNRLLLLLALLITAVTGAWAQDPTTYKVTMKEGAKDASNWTITPTAATTTGVAEEQTVTLTYNGRLNVKSVKALTTGGAWAQGKLIYEKDFSSDASYPFYLDAAEKTGASATVTDGLLVLTNPSVQATNWDVQPEIGRLTSATPTTQGNTYRVVMQYKTTVAGSVTFALGSQEDWNIADWSGQTITVSNDFQTCEAYFNNYPYNIAVSHILLQFGELVGTITIKKVEVYELYPFDGISWTASTKTATIAEMPAGNVLVTPEYYPGMLTLASNNNDWGKVSLAGTSATATQMTALDSWAENESPLTADEMTELGFKRVSKEEALAWTDVPANGFLIYDFNSESGKVKYVQFYNGQVVYEAEEVITHATAYNTQPYFTTGISLPEGFEKDDDGNIYVAAGTQFTITATPAEGYHLVSWSDDATITDLERTITMGENDTTLTASFAENVYDITFNALNANTIESGKATVSVKDGDAEAEVKNLDEDAKLKGVKVGSTVTLTAAEGYKFMFGGTDDSDSQLTVHDGTATNGYVPFYGFYADAYLKSEFVMPASELTDMSGAEISAMTFYASTPAAEPWTSNVQVFVKEVSETSLSGFTGTSGATVVYEGTINGTQETMTIDFAQPYTYNGGNLLVGFYNTTLGNYKSVTWVGETVTGASVQGYNYGSLDAIDATQRNFIPKTTFSYNASTLILEDELSFQMPANDTLVSYTLVRDMTVDVNAEANADSYYVIKRNNVFDYLYPDDVTLTVTDVIDAENPVVLEAGTDYIATLQRLDGEDNWVNANVLVPDTFRYVIAGIGAYTDTIYTDPIVLKEAYEVEVAANSYATYYQKDALTLETEEEEATIYTIASIEGDKAILSEPIDAAPAETPLLIFNSKDEDRKIILLSTNEPNLALTVAPEFQGTLRAQDMDGSSDAVDYYVCNKHDFVWVRNAGTIAANRCWLEISNSNARALNIVFDDEATSIKNLTPTLSEGEGAWYDLNGRKLNGMPTKKGVYILNGKKTVIK